MDNKKYCSVSKKCSGCQLSNMDYRRQLRFKQNEVRIRFNRLCSVQKILGAEKPLNYRNKAQFMFRKVKGRTASGIYQSADKTVVITDSCALHTKEQNEVAKVLCSLFDSFKIEPYDLHKRRGLVKSVIVRQSFHTGELMVVIVCDYKGNFPSEKTFAQSLVEQIPKVASVILTKHRGTTITQGEHPKVIYGKASITDRICSLDFIISYNSFFQINPMQTEVLYSTAVKMAELTKEDTVLDAYSGTGTIGMICAPLCKQVYSVELNENAVKDARENKRINNIDNVSLVCADSEEYIEALAQDNSPLDVALLDPPRAGCSRSFLTALCRLSPKRIVYISCNMDTQVRDVRYLLKNGYELKKVQGVDMFPFTKHTETVILLSRKDVRERIKFDVNVEDLHGRASSTATYSEIKAYILEKYGLKVSSLYIAQIKDKCGFEKRENYNIGEGKSKELICPPEKEQAIMDAFRHFGMLRD
ncbi:MAG: 23S rRNA (uracil(1939)-C(5))-methyltransferase RlmD [Ruminococcus sp.]|nr:23S rRNA (uracil(1939)-C(5))-methyltransferase RlmD [Ruminococcus sp.]